MNYREHAVTGRLAAYIKKLWVLDNSHSPLPACNKAVLPNGCFNIALVTGKGASATTQKACFAIREGVYFCGQMTRAVSVDIQPHTKVIMVQLFPWTPASFGHGHLARCTDMLTEIREPGRTLASFSPAIQSDEAALLALLHCVPLPEGVSDTTLLLQKTCSLMLGAGGKISLLQVLAQVGCSARVLQKCFADAVGLSPKAYLGIIRLREAADQIAYPEATGTSLTALALEHAYYDQAHFINAFRQLTHTTPGKFDPASYLLALKK